MDKKDKDNMERQITERIRHTGGSLVEISGFDIPSYSKKKLIDVEMSELEQAILGIVSTFNSQQ